MRESIRRKIVISMVLLGSILMVLSSSISAFSAPKILKVGMIMPLSGPISIVGVGLSRAVGLYFDKVNDEGGLQIDGQPYKLELIVEDSKLDPVVAATAAKKLIYRDEVKFIFGAITPPVASAIYQVCARAKVLHLITWIDAPGTPGDISPNKPYAVRTIVSSDAAWEMDYEYLMKTYPKAKKVFWVVPSGGVSIERARKVTEAYGFEFVGHVLWDLGTVDFMPYYTKALSTKPDIIHAATSAQAGDQLKTARQMGYKGVFVSDSPLAPEIIKLVAGKEACYDVVSNGMDFAHATPSMKESIDRWDAKYSEPYFSDVPVTWSQAEIFVQALKKADSLDTKKVMAAFESMINPGSFMTCFGSGHMGGEKRFGVNRVVVRPIPISRIVNGKVQFVGFKMPVVDK